MAKKAFMYVYPGISSHFFDLDTNLQFLLYRMLKTGCLKWLKVCYKWEQAKDKLDLKYWIKMISKVHNFLSFSETKLLEVGKVFVWRGNTMFLLSDIRWFSYISWCFVKWIMVLFATIFIGYFFSMSYILKAC